MTLTEKEIKQLIKSVKTDLRDLPAIYNIMNDEDKEHITNSLHLISELFWTYKLKRTD